MSRARGEVRFEADGKEWTLRYSTNALCELEEAINLPTTKIVAQMQDPEGVRLGLLRSVFWAGLIDAHQGIKLEDVGEITDEIGVERVALLVGDALTAAFGDSEKTDRPQKGAAAGTGANSK